MERERCAIALASVAEIRGWIRLKLGTALVVEHRDLAVENRLRCLRPDVAARSARDTADRSAFRVREIMRRSSSSIKHNGAHAVPFHFVEPRSPGAAAWRVSPAWVRMLRGIGDLHGAGRQRSGWRLEAGGWLAGARLSAISSWVRPVSTLRAWSSISQPGVALVVLLLDQQPLVAFAAALHVAPGRIRRCSFSPCRRNLKSPRAICAAPARRRAVRKLPRSHSITLPAP